MVKKSKIICKNNFKNTGKSAIAAELTEKMVKLICQTEKQIGATNGESRYLLSII